MTDQNHRHSSEGPERSPLPSPEQIEAFSKDELPASLATYRVVLSLLQKSPDQIAAALKGLDPEEARDAIEGFREIATYGTQVSRLLERIDHSTEEAQARRPGLREKPTIALDRTLILRKESKVQYDMRQQGFESDAELRQWYQQQGLTDIDGLYERHQEHVASVRELEGILGTSNSYVFGALSEEQRRNLIESDQFDLIISLGGDDTAKDISRYLFEKPLLILNSDKEGSVGALASHTRSEFSKLFSDLSEGNFLVEDWPRLEARIQLAGGKIVSSPPALNEIEIGDMYTKWPFRGVILQEGKTPTPVKGNGLIVAVPAGITGWFTSETEGIYPLGHSRARTDKVAELAVRGRYRFGETEFEDLFDEDELVPLRPGVLRAGEEIVIRSTSNHTATINVDSAWEHRFPRGSEVVIRIPEQPLTVISKQVPTE